MRTALAHRIGALAGVLVLCVPMLGAGQGDAAVPLAASSTAPGLPAPAPSPAPQRAFFELTVNGVAAGSALVLLRGSDVLVRADDLVRAGVLLERLSPETVDGTAFVSLSGLGPAAAFKADDAALSLTVTVPAEFFAANRLGGDAPTALAVANASHSGFLNYAVGTGGTGVTLNGELGVSVAHGLFDTMMRRDTVTSRFVFDQTNFTMDNVKAGSRAVFGETFVVADDFAGTGGAQTLVGATLTHDRTLSFSQIRNSGSEISGVATTPSVVEVYVNGALVSRQEIAPGPFALSNLPLRTGSNQATVVIKDAYGRSQTVSQSIYTTPDLLRKGEREYQLGFGKEINDYDLTDGRPLDAIGRYAVGLGDNLTIGGRAIVGQELTNAALTIATTGRYGELSAVVAASNAAPLASRSLNVIDSAFGATPAPISVTVPPGTRRVSGEAAGVAYNYTGRLASFGVSLLHQSPLYAALGRAALSDRISSDLEGFVQMAVGARRTLTLSVENLTPRDQDPLREVSLAFATAISRAAVVSVNIGERRLGPLVGPDIGVRVDANLNRLFGAHVSSQTRDGHYQRTLDVERVQPGRFGASFDLQQTESDIYNARSLDGEYLTPHGNAAVFVSQSSGSKAVADLSYSGAIASAGGSLFLTQPISGAFAVVDTGGIAGAHVIANGEDVGVADRRGRVLVPNLFAYGRNTIGIDTASLPTDAVVDDPLIDIAPPNRGGALVAFKGHVVRAYVGVVHVRTRAGIAAPAYGQLRLGAAASSPVSDIGDDGTFYFEKLAPGTYPATIRYAGGSCAFSLIIPRATTTITNVGTHLCEAAK